MSAATGSLVSMCVIMRYGERGALLRPFVPERYSYSLTPSAGKRLVGAVLPVQFAHMMSRMIVAAARIAGAFGVAFAIVPLTARPAIAQTPVTRPTIAPPSITATPQTTVGEGKVNTTIDWTTGDGSIGEVYVSIKGAPELLFSGQAPSGTGEANWVDPGIYVFRLYEGTSHKRVLAEVTVTRTLPPSAKATPSASSAGSGFNPASVGIGAVLLVFIVWVLVRAARHTK